MSDRPAAAERVPPQDFIAEQSVIGSMLLEPGAAAIAMAICSETDFYWEDHQTIYRAIEACHEESMPVDLVTVSHKLREQGVLEQVGGGTYLTALLSQVPTAAHVASYANIVAGCGVKRKLIADLRGLEDEAWSATSDPADITNRMVDTAVELMNARFAGGQLRPWRERKEDVAALIAEAIKGKRPLSAQRLGIAGVDEMIGPLANHRVVVVKGGSGEGKTHVMVNAAASTMMKLFEADDPRAVCIFSTESPGMYETRLLAWCAGVNNLDLINGFDGARDEKKRDTLLAVGESVTELPLAIEEGEVTPERIDADLRRYAAKHGGIALVILDYLQETQIDETKDRRLEFVKLARRLKHLSQDVYRVPFLVASQVTFNQGTGQWQTAESQQVQNTSTLTVRLHLERKKGQTEGGRPFLVGEKTRIGMGIGRVPIRMDKTTSHVYMVDDHREEKGGEHDRF